MTEPSRTDSAQSAADEALQQQPVANPDAVAEADQDIDTESASNESEDDGT